MVTGKLVILVVARAIRLSSSHKSVIFSFGSKDREETLVPFAQQNKECKTPPVISST